MSKKFNIIRNSKMSVDSVDVERSITFDVDTSYSLVDNTNVKATIDANEQYIKERNACNDYRLIITIKPYCTNVLFNACTECVINEGSDNVDVVMMDDIIDESTMNSIKDNVKGKNNYNDKVGIYDMIRNTEYSKEDIGFEYHPGLDIFNNHIIRNKSYRIVNDYSNERLYRDKFNTISDYMRLPNGNVLKKCCRTSIDDDDKKPKHLYDKDDILRFYTGDAINENLREQDGWFGFYNTSVISAKDKNGNDMDISRVINSKGNCEFIDMYPDRTLFSFVPKYNPYRNRLEYNWDYAITYAFDSTTTYRVCEMGNDGCKDIEKPFNLIQNGNVNALATITVQYRKLPNGSGAIFFRSATKHNLKPMDKVYIYFDENEDGRDWHKSCKTYLVAGVGDINHKQQDYYFYITDLDLLEEIFCTPYLCDIDPQQAEYTYSAWDYVRDYFYTEYDSDNVPDFDENKTTKLRQLVKYNGNVYIAKEEHTGDWDDDHFDEFDPTNYENVVEYPDIEEIEGKIEGGLTNIPTENDWIIKVDGEPYILCNHDRNIQYDGSTDTFLFIQAIINNAFTNNDVYSETNPDNEINPDTNKEVNPSALGLFSDYISIRFAKTNGNYDCNYYVRKFKKVPGLNGLTLDNETYQLAFSNTIYGDKIAQSVFTDNINVVGLKDNLGRDLTEVFLTIVKSNKGHDKWYIENDYSSAEVEYSHCFGKVTCGFELSQENNDTFNIRKTRGEYYDVTLINPDGPKVTIPNNYDEEFTTEDIKIDNDWFYGDIVEFCPWTCEETVISDVCFRFNTAQRELEENDNEALFKFDEILSDDYDLTDFKIGTYNVNHMTRRLEGYYHKAHYRIGLKDLSPVVQGSHPYITVLEAVPVQADGIYILVRCSLKHNLMIGSKVLLRDTVSADTPEWWLNVAYIPNDYTFVMNTVSRDDSHYVDWITICKNLNENKFTLRAKNTQIPENASRLGVNTYLWRTAVDILDITNNNIETNNYVFSNNAIYVDKCFNFYLRRQDPYNVNGLYFDGSKCTIECNQELTEGGCDNVLNMTAIDKWFLGDKEGIADVSTSDQEYNDPDYKAQC